MIRDEDAPWYYQAEQIGEYVAKGFVPYSITNMSKSNKEKRGVGRMGINFLGFVDAPASVSRSDFGAFVAHGGKRGWASIKRTRQQADYSEKLHDASAAIRRGDEADMSDLTDHDAKKARAAARKAVPEIRFGKLSMEDKIRAWDLATPEEREKYHLAEIMGRANIRKSVSFERLDEDQKAYVLARIKEITGG